MRKLSEEELNEMRQRKAELMSNLHGAVKSENLVEVKKLLRKTVQYSKIDNGSHTMPSLEEILSTGVQGGNQELYVEIGKYALYYACENGDLERVKKVLSNFKEGVSELGGMENMTPSTHYSTLSAAIASNNPEIVKALINAGVDINAYDRCDKPIHYAARVSNLAMVKALVELGADANVVDADGDNTLHHWVRLGLHVNKNEREYLEGIRFLLEQQGRRS